MDRVMSAVEAQERKDDISTSSAITSTPVTMRQKELAARDGNGARQHVAQRSDQILTGKQEHCMTRRDALETRSG